MRVLVYEHSAVARDILGRVLRELGAEVVSGGRAETFIPIDTENDTDELLDRLEGLAAAGLNGRRLDAVVSTDGDSDRPLVAAILPEGDPSGRRVRFCRAIFSASWSPTICALTRWRSRSAPMTSSTGARAIVACFFARQGSDRPMSFRRSTSWCARPHIGASSAGKQTGDFRRVADHGRVADNRRAADARRSVAHPREPVRRGRAGLFTGHALERAPGRYGRSGLIDGVPVPVSTAILAQFVVPGDAIEVEIDDGGRVTDRSRSGGVLPVPEAVAESWQKRRELLARFFGPEFGFDRIIRINVLDGVRVDFRNGDVVQVRPSGNAPQLRIYANADSQARADQIVEFGLREPDGILRRLEKAFS